MIKAMLYSTTADQKVKKLNDHFHPKIKTYNRHEVVVPPSNDNKTMGIIISGAAYLATINLDYQKRIIDYYEANDIFCSHLISDLGSESYYIYAHTKCTVAFLDYSELLQGSNETLADLQGYLIENTMRRSLIHIDILSQRTLRNKLITFLQYCKKQRNSNSFVLPVSLTELADYLAVDRSAMMREIGKMKDENIIMSKGRKITLLN